MRSIFCAGQWISCNSVHRFPLIFNIAANSTTRSSRLKSRFTPQFRCYDLLVGLTFVLDESSSGTETLRGRTFCSYVGIVDCGVVISVGGGVKGWSKELELSKSGGLDGCKSVRGISSNIIRITSEIMPSENTLVRTVRCCSSSLISL
jgi:hypothetical protein